MDWQWKQESSFFFVGDLVVGILFRVAILVGVGINDLVIYGGVMICFFSDKEDSPEEEDPIYFPGVSGAFLFLKDFFSCSNLSNFSKIGLYRNLSCRIFPKMWPRHRHRKWQKWSSCMCILP